MCEQVRVWVCAVSSKRGRALNGEMGKVRGRLCASAQAIDAVCVKSRVHQAPTRGSGSPDAAAGPRQERYVA